MLIMKTIWTIGHSTRSLEELIELLKSFDIELLADIRSFPGSRRYPHFNKEALQKSLPQEKIEYIHLPELGGRRKTNPDSKNTVWRNAAFRGYADYMETDEFKNGITGLEKLALEKRTAYMCSEAVLVALPSVYGFRLFKSSRMESSAHHGRWQKHGTSIYCAGT